MNLRTLASASGLALLLSVAMAGQAHAQVFAPVTFSVLANGDITGTGSGVTLTGTSLGETFFGGTLYDDLSVTASDSPYAYVGTDLLQVTGTSATYVDGGFSFQFTASPAPTGTGTAFSGTAGVVTFPNAVPEPGSVAMLAGLAIAGSGFATRRLRRRSA